MRISTLAGTEFNRLYIDDVLHLAYRRDRYLGLSSWRYDGLYTIEVVLDGGAIRVEYDTEAKWVAVLNKLDQLAGCAP